MSGKRPRYYVIGCTRNNQKSIRDVMSSLVNQTYPPSKIIIVNDGSTDGTAEILETFMIDHPDMIEIITTTNKTTDFSRIPKLWNMCLRRDYEYHMVIAGDVILEHDYAEKVLNEMEADNQIVIASGNTGKFELKDPHGAGRFVRQDFFYKYYKNFQEIMGYESEMLFKTRIEGYQTKVIRDAKFVHTDKLGHRHNFTEFGMGMKALGYHPLYVLGRAVTEFLRNDHIGRRGACNMLKSYLTYKPEQTGYYSLFSENTRKAIREYQRKHMIRLFKKLFRGMAK